ncbi:MAG TPA: response regulator transcription factor, partial [Patescibacteria group bacterium]
MNKILIIDDDQGILEVVKIILTDSGYEVFAIDDGENVMERVIKMNPDLILLDLWMPGISGKEVCLTLKSHSETKDVPIIMLSASVNTKEVAEECKADGSLSKPFEMDEL